MTGHSNVHTHSLLPVLQTYPPSGLSINPCRPLYWQHDIVYSSSSHLPPLVGTLPHADGRLLLQQHPGQSVEGGGGGPAHHLSGALQWLCLGWLHLWAQRRCREIRRLLRRCAGVPAAPLPRPAVSSLLRLAVQPEAACTPQHWGVGRTLCVLYGKLRLEVELLFAFCCGVSSDEACHQLTNQLPDCSTAYCCLILQTCAGLPARHCQSQVQDLCVVSLLAESSSSWFCVLEHICTEQHSAPSMSASPLQARHNHLP